MSWERDRNVSRAGIEECLRRMNAAEHLIEEVARPLAQGAESRLLAKGESIVWPGEGQHWSFLFVHGRGRVYRLASSGKAATLYFTQMGDILPRISERSYMDAACDQTTVCRVPRCRFLAVQECYPEVAVRIQELQSQRLMEAYDRLEDLICLDTRGRVARALARLGSADNNRVSITREEIGSMTGVSRQQVTTCLGDFQEQGWIHYEQYRHRAITVVDPSALADMEADR